MGGIKAHPGGHLASSGQPVRGTGLGLSYDFSFVHSRLQTKDCPSDRVVAECGRHPVVEQWHWTGHDFARQA